MNRLNMYAKLLLVVVLGNVQGGLGDFLYIQEPLLSHEATARCRENGYILVELSSQASVDALLNHVGSPGKLPKLISVAYMFQVTVFLKSFRFGLHCTQTVVLFYFAQFHLTTTRKRDWRVLDWHN